MNKSDFCQCLFDEIKDNVEFDSDVVALESLLLKMLYFNENNSFKNWKYLMLKYDFETLGADINFLPIIKTYPEHLFRKVGIKHFFNYMSTLPNIKAKCVYKNIFNVYNPDCFIYQSINYYISQNKKSEEKELIETILNKSWNFSRMVFDKAELVKQVILLHIKKNNVPVGLLGEFINDIDNKKEQAVLKTLLVDYLFL